MSAPIDHRFEGTLRDGDGPGGWTTLIVPDSAELFGTRKPVKVAGTIDGREFAATLLPTGGGTHMLPVKAALRKAIAKGGGDPVSVHLVERVS